MASAKQPKAELPKAENPIITCTSVAVFRIDHLLSQAFELTIVDGVVVSMKELGRAPNVPTSTIGACRQALWNQIRNQKREE